MLSLDDTAIAFSGKTDADLNRSYWLFKLVGNTGLVSMGQKFTAFAIETHLPIRGFIKATIFRQFCGGEDIHECLKAIENLGKYNIGSILDYSAEGSENENDFIATADEIIQTIELAKNNKHIPFAVFKPTGVISCALLEKISASTKLTSDEQQAWERAKTRVDAICKKAYKNRVQLLVDAEDSWIQEAIDSLVHEMMLKYNKEKCIVFNTAQLYRKDRLEYLKNLLKEAREKKYFVGIKLVRGAYMEKERERAEKMGYPSPINETKAETDRLFDAALTLCVENIDIFSICAGSHNEKSAMHLVKLMQQYNLPNAHPNIWFSQLLGMSDHISFNVANAGYNVAKYVPYGPVKNVLPYLIRRAQENTSVKGQTGRELSLIIKEKQRRAALKNGA
ncbi:MAG: proline dehydrogenase family protein [Bacteroidia bacterium]